MCFLLYFPLGFAFPGFCFSRLISFNLDLCLGFYWVSGGFLVVFPVWVC